MTTMLMADGVAVNESVTLVCPGCGRTEWEVPDPDKHQRLYAVFGPDIWICHNCARMEKVADLLATAGVVLG